MNSIEYSFAMGKDIPAIKQLLSEAMLPFEDIDGHINHFLVAKEHNAIIGSIGLEDLNQYALLRSLVVKEQFRSKGIARELLYRLSEYALQHNLEVLYLLTTTASGYFQKEGFTEVDRNNLPDEVKNTKEFTSLCPSSVICMCKKLN